MELKLANYIVEKLQDVEEDARVYQDYSGRFMYGKKTTGVITNNPANIAEALIGIIANIQEDQEEGHKYTLEEMQACGARFADLNKSLSVDNMAKDYIVY